MKSAEDRLGEIIAHYVRDLENGSTPDREQLLAQNPDLAEDLRDFFKHRDRMQDLFDPFRSAATRALNVRCPHCHNAIQLLDDASITDISCPSCGSSFSLAGEQTLSQCSPAERTIGHFQLLDRVGVGQFGGVWKARDTELDRTVAVKIPHGARLDSTHAELFLRDARAAAQLKHPNIVSVHEVGKQDDTIYIVSDFIHGATLKDWIAAKRLTPREVAELCITIARALHHAHESGVIHRDLKPTNIMMDTDGEPYIVDFGLAKRDVGEITMTVEGQILGTPAYMSPEQARGEGHTVDRRADIYSLGVILFELLTGELPFRGDKQMLIVQILKDEPPKLRKLNSRLAVDLETICLKCLEKDPSRRYESANAVADDLHRWVNKHPIQARPITQWQSTVRWCQRRPTIAALLSIIILITVGGFAGVTTFWQRAKAAYKQADHARQGEQRRAQSEANAKRMAELSLIDMYTTTGLLASDQDKPAEAALWFSGAAGLAKGKHHQRFHSNRLRVRNWIPQTIVPIRLLLHPDATITGLHFHPKLPYLLVHTTERSHVWDLEKEQELNAPAQLASSNAVMWSPDGTWLAVGAKDGDLRFYSFPNFELLQQIDHESPITVMCFTRDGRRLAIGGATVRVWDCDKKEFVTEELPHPNPVALLTFSPSGLYLVSVAEDTGTRVFSLAEDREKHEPLFEPLSHDGITQFVINGGGMYPPAIVGDDHALVIKDALKLKMHDLKTGELLQEMVYGKDQAFSLVSSPDNKKIVVGTRPIATMFQMDTDWTTPIALEHSHTTQVSSVAFSPDGSVVLTGGGNRTARLWSAKDGAPLCEPILHSNNVFTVAFGPDGLQFATAEESGAVRIWSRQPHEERDYLVPIRGEISLAALSQDGRYLVPSGSSFSLSRLHQTQVVQVATGKRVGEVIIPGGYILDAVFSPSGNTLAIACSAQRSRAHRRQNRHRGEGLAGNIQLWDFRSGTRISPPIKMPSEPRCVDYSPDGNSVAVFCAGRQLVVIDAGNGTIARQLQTSQDREYLNWYLNNGKVRFSPDSSSILAWAGEDVFQVFDAKTGNIRYTLKHGAMCQDARFSSNGALLATCSRDGTARVWDFATGEPLGKPMEHPDWVFTAKFTPDGKNLVTACRDSMARIWNWRSGQLSSTPMRHKNEIMDIEITRDGRWVLTASHDATVRVWQVSTGKPVSPPYPVLGMAWQIRLTPDAQYAVVGGKTSGIGVIDLSHVHDEAEMPQEDVQLLAEIVSGQRLVGADGVTNLTAAEFARRWQLFRNRMPVQFPFRLSDESRERWHRKQVMAKRRAGELGAATWHLNHLLASREENLGAHHPDTFQALDDLAATYRENHDYAKLIPLFQDHRLTVGDSAPPLKLAKWMKGDPIDGFQYGRIYVVEFWASWCRYCWTSMPYISQLKKEFGDRVTIVGITNEDEETVRSFFGRVQNSTTGATWDDVVNYRIAFDQGRLTNAAYATASGHTGIPTAFIIGRHGRIEWIGHPMNMKEPLESIVANQWDSKAFRTAYWMEQARQELYAAQSASRRDGNWEGTLQFVDALITEYPGQFEQEKFDTLLAAERYDAAVASADELARQHWEDSDTLNGLAWIITTKIPESERDLDLALQIVQRASTLDSTNSNLLDTVARVHYERGNLEEAIAWQRKSVNHASTGSVLGFDRTLQKYVAEQGEAYRLNNQLDQAIAVLEEAVRARKMHPQLPELGDSLRKAYRQAKRFDDFARMIDEDVTEQRRIHYPDSPTWASLLARAAVDLMEIGHFPGAERLLRECIQIRKAAMPDHWTTFSSISMLGGSLLGQQEYAEAEPLLLAGYEGMIKQRESETPGADSMALVEAIDRLIELHSALKHPHEVAKWKNERAKYARQER